MGMNPCTCGSNDCSSPRAALAQKGRRLEYFTLSWNLIEAGVAIGSGIAAGSIALFGFGIDSVIECLSGGILLWRLRTHEADERRERRACILVGVSFLLLAIYVAADSILTLVTREKPGESLTGIALACASLVVMPLLARAKRRLAAEMGIQSLDADSRQTSLCAWLSAVLLGGLVVNAAWAWWWADPVAGLIMVVLILKEAVTAFRGGHCGCH